MTSNHKANIYEELENLRNENSALLRAVDSKTEAIGILRFELEECQRERDEFRMMIETQPRSQPISSFKIIPHCPEKTHSAILSGSENTLAQLLSQSKEENKQLRQELTDLKCRLHDACSDLKILREEKSRKTDIHQNRLSIASSSRLAQQEREILIQQMEQLSSKCHAQESDTRCLLEEREELIHEKDYVRHKLHRLNYILNVLLSKDYFSDKNRPHHRTIDLDAIIKENRYLQQRTKQLDEEKSLAIASLSKYKSALESCRTNINSRKLRPSDGLIMSPKQVSEFLKQYEGEVDENGEKNLKFICVALIDALNQKSRVVRSQKAANKMLIERVYYLEKRFVCSADENTSLDSANLTNLISTSLLDGYNPASSLGDKESVDLANVLQRIQNTLAKKERRDVTYEDNISEGFSSTPDKAQNLRNGTKTQASSIDSMPSIDCPSSDPRSPSLNSESEEIVDIENLDSYFSNLKEKKIKKLENEEKTVCQKSNPEIPSTKMMSRNSSDASFNIDISDYDSDDDNLEVTLQDWQSECEKASTNNIILKLSPKRMIPGLLPSKTKWNLKDQTD